LTTIEREERVLKVIQDLGLSCCADTPLNLVSGGERKRTSVGLEIISDPVLLLLDEATSG
jgi:ABC-type multidrug transport system ATPase subunit